MPTRPSDAIRDVDPNTEEWVGQLGDALFDLGIIDSVAMAASRARDMAMHPEIGPALTKLVQGVMAMRQLKGLRLTPTQVETLEMVLRAMHTEFSEIVSGH